MVHNFLKFLKNLRTNQSHLFDWNRKQLNDSNSLLETKAPSPNQEILEKQKNRRKYCRNHNNSFKMKSLKWFMVRIFWSHGSTNYFVGRPLGSNLCEIFRLFTLVRTGGPSPLWSEPCPTLVILSLMLGSCWEMTVH